MAAQLPLESWILIAVAVGLGFAIELAFLRAQRGRRGRTGRPGRPGTDPLEPGRTKGPS